MKVSVFIATSVDGFIAGENGELDWLPDEPEDHGYEAFIASVDTLVMGRNTFDKVLTFGAWPFGKKPVIVLSSRPIEPVSATVEQMACTPQELLERLAARGAAHLYLDGGRTITSFLSAGLVDQLILTRVPVLLGRGIPLFGRLESGIRLEHVESRAFPSGLVQDRYVITREPREDGR